MDADVIMYAQMKHGKGMERCGMV